MVVATRRTRRTCVLMQRICAAAALFRGVFDGSCATAPLGLGSQALDDPASAFAAEAQAVVEAVGAALPELDGVGDDADSSPGLGARDHVAAGLVERRLRAFELLARRDDLGLRAHGRRE